MEHHILPHELDQVNAAGCDDEGNVVPRPCSYCGAPSSYGIPPVWWCWECNQFDGIVASILMQEAL